MSDENAQATGTGGLQALWRVMQYDPTIPWSTFTETARREAAAKSGKAPTAQSRRVTERRYVDALNGDVLPYPPRQGLRITTNADEDDDARELGEPAVRVHPDVLGLPTAERVREIERHRWLQLEEPRRHEWAPGTELPVMGLQRLLGDAWGR